MFKAVMPNNHNKVLLKKSLRVMDEGLDIARLIKCPQKNRRLLGNERTQRRKEKVVHSLHIGDDGNTPESDLPFNKIPWPNVKIFNLWVPRKKSHLLLYCFGQVQAREDVQDRTLENVHRKGSVRPQDGVHLRLLPRYLSWPEMLSQQFRAWLDV